MDRYTVNPAEAVNVHWNAPDCSYFLNQPSTCRNGANCTHRHHAAVKGLRTGNCEEWARTGVCSRGHGCNQFHPRGARAAPSLPARTPRLPDRKPPLVQDLSNGLGALSLASASSSVLRHHSDAVMSSDGSSKVRHASRNEKHELQAAGGSSSSTFLRIDSNANGKGAVIIDSIEKKLQKHKQKFHVSCLIDASGSMAGSKETAARAGVNQVVDSLEGRDRISLLSFNNTVTNHTGLESPMKIGEAKKQNLGSKLPSSSGGTALRDAIAEAIQGMKKLSHSAGKKGKGGKDHRYHQELVLITDGEDNGSSRVSAAQLKELVAHPGVAHFHMLLIFVGTTEEVKNEYKELFKGLKTVRIVREQEDNATAIRRAFQHVVDRIVEVRKSFKLEASDPATLFAASQGAAQAMLASHAGSSSSATPRMIGGGSHGSRSPPTRR